MELPQNLLQAFACVASGKKFLPKMELPQNLLQTFACVASEKKFVPKMELPQNLLQTFACVASDKKISYQKWSCLKIYCKHKIFFIPVYMNFKYSKRFRFAPSFNKIYKIENTS